MVPFFPKEENEMQRWIVPALCATLLHLLMCGLLFFSPNLKQTRPAWGIAAGRVITLDLVDMPSAQAQAQASMPAPLPLPKKTSPQKHLAEKSTTLAAATQTEERPISKPDPVQSSSSDGAPGIEVFSAGAADSTTPPSEDNASQNGDGGSLKERGADKAGLSNGAALLPLYQINPAPEYPAMARRRNYQGTVMLDVLVDPQGRTSQAKVRQSCGYQVLDDSALKSVQRWRFEPARRMGQAIEMWVRVPVRFELH